MGKNEKNFYEGRNAVFSDKLRKGGYSPKRDPRKAVINTTLYEITLNLVKIISYNINYFGFLRNRNILTKWQRPDRMADRPDKMAENAVSSV